ncbi:hypothetical protein Dimus_000740 [Dionaea muscipula]
MERHRGDRDRDSYRDRDRDRDRDRYGSSGNDHSDSQPYRRPSRFSDGPPPPSNLSHSPGNFRSGFSDSGGGGHRAFSSPPRQSLGPAGVTGGGAGVGGFPSPVGAASAAGPGGELRAMGVGHGGAGGDDGYASNFQSPQPLSGQKRGFPFSGRGGSPGDRYDGNKFVKLFVGSVPRTAVEEDIRPLFEQHGNVMEVAFIKDRRTGQQQGCCFIKYATSEEAERAIRGLHNQYTLPGGVGPIHVRYADGERERLGNGTVEYKLFVASLNRQATEKEVEEIFARYGRVEDVYLMRDESRNSRGSGFVKFSNRDSAMAAINGLNGIYTMMGSDRPLIVRFADTKRPRPGETRGGVAVAGAGVGPHPSPVIRPVPFTYFVDPLSNQRPPNVWQTTPSLENHGPSSNAGVLDFGNQMPPGPGDAVISSNAVGHLGPLGGHAGNSLAGPGVLSSSMQQGSSQPFPTHLISGQPLSPLPKQVPSPHHLPSSMQLHPHGQAASMYAQPHTSQESARNLSQPQIIHAGGQTTYSHTPGVQYLPGSTGQLPASQLHPKQSASTSPAQHTPSTISLQPNAAAANPQQLPAPPQFSLQQSSQLAEMLTQQKQSLQATLQSSQQAVSELQQQWHMMQPSSQNQHLLSNFQAAGHQIAGSRPGVMQATDATSSASSGPVVQTVPSDIPRCSWTEHTSPDGFKYYYDSATGKSTWEKPEELISYEQQKQKMPVQQPQSLSSLQAFPSEQIPQQLHMQMQYRHTEQLQKASMSSSYSNSGAAGKQINGQELNYYQPPSVSNAANNPGSLSQGRQASEDWMWYNKS